MFIQIIFTKFPSFIGLCLKFRLYMIRFLDRFHCIYTYNDNCVESTVSGDDAVSDANDVSTDIGELWEKFPVNELFIDPSGET